MAEKFIPDHVLIYLSAGRLRCYDATKSHTFGKGECFLARKNRLAKYKIESASEAQNPIAFCFDEPFLKAFAAKHPQHSRLAAPKDTFIPVDQNSFAIQLYAVGSSLLHRPLPNGQKL